MIANYGLLKVNVAIASCTAAGVTSICVSAVGTTTSAVTLVGRIWCWCRVITLIVCSVRGAVLTILHKADTVRNQVVGALTVAVNSERRTEGRNNALHQITLRLLRVCYRLVGNKAKVERSEAKQLDVVTLGKVVHHIVGIAVEYRLHVSRGSCRFRRNLLRYLLSSQCSVTNRTNTVNSLTPHAYPW